MARPDALDMPEALSNSEDAMEFVRFWISGGQDHVRLRIGAFEKETEPAAWGSIAADIARHALRGMVQDDPDRDEEVLLAEIERAFIERLAATTGLSGSLAGKA